ncbi:hypothetical protein BJX99DRAFT_236912 [Aspergillus californicus]
MGWSEVSPGRWECPLGGMEDYFSYIVDNSAAHCNGRQDLVILSTFTVDINVPDVEAALKQAWKRLRYKHPQLAATTEENKKVYEVPDESSLQEWVENTFIVSAAVDVTEMYRTVKPINQSTLYYIPNSSELALRVRHHISDGIGSLRAMHYFFKVLEEPSSEPIPWGSEPIRLPPSFEEALGNPPLTPEESEKGAARMWAYMGNMPGIGVPTKNGTVPAGESLNVETCLSPATTAALIKASKERGISVTATVHAAYVQTLINHADPNSNTTRYTGITAHNVRKYLPQTPEYQDAFSLYYSAQFATVNLPASVSEIARQLHHHYQMSLNPDALRVHDAFTKTICAVVRTPEYQAAPVPSDAGTSSIGIVERYLQQTYADTVTVRRYKLQCDVVIGMTTLHFWTFRGQLHFVFSFNGAYEQPETIRMYLEDLKNVLREEFLGGMDA